MTFTEAGSAGLIDDDVALVAAARGGNTTSFEALVRRYETRIYRLAKTIARNESDAEEITQEAFFKAFRHIDDFKGQSRFYSWLVRIAVNEALMKLRRRRAGHFSLDDPAAIEQGYVPREIEGWGPTPEERYSQKELAELLAHAISELQPRLRCVFQLRDVESLSTEETASLLGISISAVKSRLLRARLALREKLNRFMRNDAGAQSPTPLFCAFMTRGMRQAPTTGINAQ